MRAQGSELPAFRQVLWPRLKACLFCAVLGPAIAGVVLWLLLSYPSGSAAWFNPSYRFFGIVWLAIQLGTPAALLAGLLGLWASQKSGAVSVWAFVGVAVLALTLGMIYTVVVTGWKEAALVGIFGLIPVVLSAPICWRITKRWHSPDRTS